MPSLEIASSVPSQSGGMSCRDFIRVCTLAAAAVGLPGTAAKAFADTLAKGRRPSVIWLSFQECTGCTESLLRTMHPALDELIVDLISLDYHEALLAPSGHLAEAARQQAMRENDGKYILVCEGAIPTRDNGIHCKIGDRTALDLVKEAADHARAIIAIGSCASFGGIAAAEPNPTGAQGIPQVLAGKTVVTLPGCPANPYVFLGTAPARSPGRRQPPRPLAGGRPADRHRPRREPPRHRPHPPRARRPLGRDGDGGGRAPEAGVRGGVAAGGEGEGGVVGEGLRRGVFSSPAPAEIEAHLHFNFYIAMVLSSRRTAFRVTLPSPP
jgi:hypothetical protein